MSAAYKEKKEHLQKLAHSVRELAFAPENAQKRTRWADHNDLKQAHNALVWVCPDDDGAWQELIPTNSLLCSDDPDLCPLEFTLRKYLYQAEFLPDDFVFEPKVYFAFPGEYTGYLYGHSAQKTAWGVPLTKPEVGSGAYHLHNFLQTEQDYQKLLQHEVEFYPNTVEHKRLRNLYTDVLEDILDVEFHLPYSVLVQSLLIELVHLRGLEELMYDLYDEPERLMQVLAHMGQSKARLLKRLEKNKMLFDNRTNIYTGSGGLGYTHAPRKKPEEVLLADLWGFADAQEFSNVSPEMFDAFAIQNQKIGLNLFGRACYGCCEPLDGKYDTIFRNLPHIRRLSVSPWSDIPQAAENIGQKAIFSWKPNPAEICSGFDENLLFAKLQEVAKLTRDCYVEIILKDIRTCGGTPHHLARFAQLAKKAFRQ